MRESSRRLAFDGDIRRSWESTRPWYPGNSMRMSRAVVIGLIVAFCSATCFAQVRSVQSRGTTTPANPPMAVSPAPHARPSLASVPPNLTAKTLPEIKNPAVLTSPILMSLQQQKQAAEVESSQIMSATAGQTTGGARVTLANKPAGMLAAKPGMSAPPPANKPPMGAVVNSQASNICLANTVGIRAVNQKSSGIIFTPDPRYNLYTIIGCGFGTTPGKIYLLGGAGAFPAHSGKIMLSPVDPVRGWTDWAIIAKVDPTITGELDQNNISLVIESASGRHGQANGFSFFAMRGPAFALKSIPSSAACSAADSSPCSPTSGYISQFGVLFSPAGGFTYGASDYTAAVFRQPMANQVQTDRFAPKLKPGFVLSSAMVQVRTFQEDQGDVLSPYNVMFRGNQIFVKVIPIKAPNSASFYESLYSIKIWVVGPAGISNPLADGQ